jgi:hypothetical protein
MPECACFAAEAAASTGQALEPEAAGGGERREKKASPLPLRLRLNVTIESLEPERKGLCLLLASTFEPYEQVDTLETELLGSISATLVLRTRRWGRLSLL